MPERKYKTWLPERGETVDDAVESEAYYPDTAADSRANDEFYAGDGFDELVVMVLDADGISTEYRVDVESRLSFAAIVRPPRARRAS